MQPYSSFSNDPLPLQTTIPDRKAAEKGTFAIDDVIPIRGFSMESVAGQLRIIEEAAYRRSEYEKGKAKREEKLQEMFRDGLISEEDVLRAADGRLRIFYQSTK